MDSLKKHKNIEILLKDYKKFRNEIKIRLIEFKKIKSDKYFYELCFCVCTPQSKAVNAFKVQQKLEEKDFLNNKNFNPQKILEDKEHYIRFHKTKAQNLIAIKGQISEICKVLESNISAENKRDWLVKNVKGIGMKEATHFLRNIGLNCELAILDRHILRNLIFYGVIKVIPKNLNRQNYLEIEKKFLEFSKKIKISINRLDLLFWAQVTGYTLK